MVSTTPRRVVYERDEHGSPYAVEVVEVERWNDILLEPPDPEAADARIVRLRAGEPPSELPRWLGVEHVPGAGPTARRVAEPPAPYETAELGQRLWPWSPTYRGPGASLGEFLSAGAAALQHPQPVPAEPRRRLELLASFAADRPPRLTPIATLRGEALERWLRQVFGTPERLSDALLLERIAGAASDEAREVVAVLRFLREAEVPAALAEHAELAVDRRVLLEQASPWRFLEGASFAGPLSAFRAWRGRYRLAYDRHYRAVLGRASELGRVLRGAAPTARAVERFDGVPALGPPRGERALAAYREAEQALGELPADPEAGAARTAGVTLGLDPPLFAAVPEAVGGLQRVLEAQRSRLASEAVSAVLARPGVPALDRLLQAIAASDLDGVERVLTDDLAAHIEELLRAGRESPLAEVAARLPRVTAESLEEAVAAFRAVLEDAVAAAPGGVVVLREDRA